MRIFVIYLLVLSSLLGKEVFIVDFNKELCRDFNLLDSVIVKSALSKQE